MVGIYAQTSSSAFVNDLLAELTFINSLIVKIVTVIIVMCNSLLIIIIIVIVMIVMCNGRRRFKPGSSVTGSAEGRWPSGS